MEEYYNDNEFIELSHEIMNHPIFLTQKRYIQHGTTSIYDHVLLVAYYCYLYAKDKKGYHLKELITGALLHDFFLYDWHIYDGKNGHKRFHGINHPGIALKNATKYFILTKREKNIIRSHMWPLTLLHLPLSKEAWLVFVMDKVVTMKEMKKRN